MIHFDSPTYLYLLLIIPVFFILMYVAEFQRKRKLKRLCDKELLPSLMPNTSALRRWSKFILTQLALAMIVIVVARPQMGTKVSNEKRNGIECIIALDISNSMLAEDVLPSRLEKSKMLVEGILDKFTNDKIGLVVFAGESYVQLPITADYVSAKMFLNNIEPSLIQTQGTDIARAIRLCTNSFTQQDKIGKAILVITDGEDHEGGAMEEAKAAKEKGMNVFILGIGSPNGAPVPDGEGGYLNDNTGNTVMSCLNEQMCRDIAAAGEGKYIHVDNTTSAQDKLNEELTKLQQGEMKSIIYSEYNEQFQAFAILCIIFLIIEICVNEAVNPYLSRITLFRRRTLSVILLILFGGLTASFAQNDRSYVRKGNKMFRSGNFDKAEVEYSKAITKNSGNPQAHYNLGCVHMQQQKDSLAMIEFEKATKTETSKLRKAMSYHNMGVIAQRHQQYEPAIKAYQDALRLNPHDNEARYNMVLCKKLLKNNNNNQNQNQNQNDKKDKNEDKQKNNQNQNDKKEDKDKKEQQKPQEQISKENAERMLEAADQQEKETRKKMEKAMKQPQRRNLQKNW